MTAAAGFAYVQARLQAGHGRLPDAAAWQSLEASQTLAQYLALARAVVDLEKPAHSVFTLRFYWAMFRVGEARLGDDTLIDLGSRSPELMAPMVFGEGYLAEAFLAAPAGRNAPHRLRIGRDRVGRSSRIGGP